MSDVELDNDSDHEVSASHSKLIDAVAQLDKGQRVKKPERSEPTLEVSEFHLVKSGISDKDAVHVQDLAKSLGKKGHHAEITKKLQAARQKAKLLTKPLEKPAADRIKRIVGFESTKKELKKWNAVITKNRTAESLKFPLVQTRIKAEAPREFVKRFRIQSDLEKELAALEPQKENIQEEKGDDFTMTLKEIMMRRQEAARFRAQQSYREAKAHRERKIKSKKFHRVQRKERIKTQLKEFETLQKTDPEAALEKLEQLDKARAEERMSLRHKSTGQWAKNKQIRAKYDKETRQVLAEQLSIGREITQKIKKDDESDDDVEEASTAIQLSANDKENPWVGRGKTDAEIDDFIKGYRSYWDGKNKDLQNEKLNAAKGNIVNNAKADTEENPNPNAGVSEDNNMEGSDSESSEMDTSRQEKEKETGEEEKEVEEEEDEEKEAEQEEEEAEEKEDISQYKNKLKQFQTSGDKVERRKGKVANDSQSEKEPKALVVKKKKKKGGKQANPIATSNWNVEAVSEEAEDNPRSKDIYELFDSLEDRLKRKVASKLQEAKESLAEPRKTGKGSRNKKRGWNEDEFDGLQMQSERKRPTIDEALDEIGGRESSNPKSELARLVELRNTGVENVAKPRPEAEIDPNKYINVKPKQLNTELPDISSHGEDALDDSENDEEQHNIISEAFADDDVVDEFRKEKAKEIEKSKPKSIDLTLPGWGSWGGKSIPVSKRKRRRFIMKFPDKVERKDENKGDVIIIEEEKPKIKEHLVNDLPYPFTSVKDFEASIRMPIGRNFVPENAHRKLIEPVVKTSIGKIIEPMDEDVLVKKPRMDHKKFTKKRGPKFAKKKAK